MDNLHEEVMTDFIGYIRFANYQGDLAQLYLAKNETNAEARNRRKRQNNNKDDSDEDDGEDVFNGC